MPLESVLKKIFHSNRSTYQITPTPEPITVYFNMVGSFQQDKCYKLTHETVSEFGNNKVLKASDCASYQQLEDTAVILPAVPSIIKIGKIAKVNLSSFEELKLCPQCKTQVGYMRSIPFCKTCGEVLVESDLLKSSTIKFTFKDSSTQIPLSCDRKLIQKLCSSPNTNDVNDILCKILNMEVTIRLKKTNNEIISIDKADTNNDSGDETNQGSDGDETHQG
uniref:Uncharacterized protein n=1 Tax=Clytia hemisphaerica TaxID=252671 RepID=A0A7M5VDA6_9CNID